MTLQPGLIELVAKDVVTIDDAPDVDQVWLPFLSPRLRACWRTYF
jgi:hypothetical protein